MFRTLQRRLQALALAVALLPCAVLAGPVDINSADAKTLARELKGIGLARAQAIVDDRAKNGPFKTADDLARVKGIGKSVVEDNRANIKVAGGKGGDANEKMREKAQKPDTD